MLDAGQDFRADSVVFHDVRVNRLAFFATMAC